jgi:hypothetical protein
MAAAVVERGLPAPGKRATDGWVRMGLIDQPHRPGLGRAGGREPRRWPATQAALFLALHQGRVHVPRTRLRELVNLPLYVWIREGDEIIPMRQVRRALATWFEIPRHNSRSAVRAAVATYVENFRTLGSSRADRRALVEAMVLARERQLRTGRYDAELLRPHLEAVFGEQVLGPNTLPFGVDVYLDWLARLDQVEARLKAASYTDEQLTSAREACRVALQHNREEWPKLALRTDIGALFKQPSTSTEMRQAGQIIVAVLGAMFEAGSPTGRPSRPTSSTVNAPGQAIPSTPPAMLEMWSKCLRGHTLLEQLRRLIAQLSVGESQPPLIRVRQHIDLEASELVAIVEALPPIPEEAPLLSAEVAYNLRSALNYLVGELARIDTRSDPEADKRQAFPIVTAPEQWPADTVQNRDLRGLSKRHRAMIERLQPFHPRGDRLGKPHPLAVLQALTNDDKYRRRPRLYQRLAYIGPLVGVERPGHHCRVDLAKLEAIPQEQWEAMLFRELEAGAELFRLPLIIDGASPEFSVDIEALTYVAMGAGVSLVQSLSGIAAMVAAILRDFQPEFDAPRARAVWKERGSNVEHLPSPPVAGLGAA